MKACKSVRVSAVFLFLTSIRNTNSLLAFPRWCGSLGIFRICFLAIKCVTAYFSYLGMRKISHREPLVWNEVEINRVLTWLIKTPVSVPKLFIPFLEWHLCNSLHWVVGLQLVSRFKPLYFWIARVLPVCFPTPFGVPASLPKRGIAIWENFGSLPINPSLPAFWGPR